MNKSENITEIAKAMVKVQAETMSAIKDKTNPHYKSTYADLTSVWEACNKRLNANGIAVSQLTDSQDGVTVTVTTMLVHESGQYLASSLTLKPSKADPQGVGSAITYARRYGLASIVGVMVEDDDGNAGSGPGGSPPAQRRVPPRGNTEAAETGDVSPSVQMQHDLLEWSGFKAEDYGRVKAAVARAMGKDKPGIAEVRKFFEKNKHRDFLEVCP